jgi:hypothetical protein
MTMRRNDVDRVVRGFAASELVEDDSLWMPRQKKVYARRILPRALWWGVLIAFTTAMLVGPWVRLIISIID